MNKNNAAAKKSLELSSCGADVLFKLGAQLCTLGKYIQAQAYFEKLITLTPDDPAVFTYLGIIYQAMRNYKKGNAYLLKAKLLLDAKGDSWCATS